MSNNNYNVQLLIQEIIKMNVSNLEYIITLNELNIKGDALWNLYLYHNKSINKLLNNIDNDLNENVYDSFDDD